VEDLPGVARCCPSKANSKGVFMSKLAVLFTGQGSQFPNMGVADLKSTVEGYKLCNMFSDMLGFDVLDALENKHDEFNQTSYVQPLIMLLEIHLYQMLAKENIKPDGFLGFSLGEITALHASGLINLRDIVLIIKNRSTWMDEQAKQTHGAMAAVLGLEPKRIIEVCNEVSTDDALMIPVNFNTPDQTVISGAQSLIDIASQALKEAGAKRVIPLSVSGAFHTPYMAPVSQKLTNLLTYIDINETEFPVYMNKTAKKHHLDSLKKDISDQVQSPVYFYQSIIEMIKDGYTHFLEIGPKPVLTAMVKKIDGSKEAMSFTTLNEIEDVKGWLKSTWN
jgi:[acyl-carrier-protein] S-malonyltransferase